jgi:diguanylate cyclase (GGDEF)-like protein
MNGSEGPVVNGDRSPRFRKAPPAASSHPVPHGEATFRGFVAHSAKAAAGYGQATVFLAVIWLLGLVVLGAVIEFERRVDETRQAQVVIAKMRNQQTTFISIAFDPAVAGKGNVPGRAQTMIRMAKARQVLNGSTATLARLGHSVAPARIERLTERYYTFANHLSVLVADGATGQAALELGKSQRPGGIQAELNAEFDRADLDYGRDAARSRKVASIGTTAAILFLLLAFSIAHHRSVRARRLSEHEAMTDALTGLGNRRKLFADMDRKIASLGSEQTVTVAIFDLDGFKAYNDTFGHPAGDALLARLGTRLAAAVGDRGNTYRIGGDEFVVTTASRSDARLLKAAQAALSERGEGFRIGCSLGSTRVVAGITLEQALHVADQLLYANKRSGRSDLRTEVKDVLLQVLAEQNGNLVDHLGHVAALAWSTAVRLDLPPEQVERARLAAELHDIGKAAIPASILEKPGPLDPQERLFMQRHSTIGERIVAAAPTLQEIAPIIRSAHERMDGTGYPDGLRLEQIPICSRIIAVVDAYDAMTSDRPYQQAMSPEDALTELHQSAGTQFDAAVVDAFTAVLAETFPSPQFKASPPGERKVLRYEWRHSLIEKAGRSSPRGV